MNFPQQALMNVAMTIANSEDSPLNQRHLADAVELLEAARCEEDDCLLPRGHDSDCLPFLLIALAQRDQLRDTLESVVTVIPPGPLRDASEDVVRLTKE